MNIGLDGNEANVKNRVGSGVYAYQLLLEFSKNTKHKFIVYLKEKLLADMPSETDDFKYKVFGPKKMWTQFALPLKLTFGIKPNVFFSMGHYGPRFSGVPYVVTIHDLSYLYFPELFNKNDLYQLTNWSKYSINNSKHIIAVSNKTKEDILKNYKVSSSKVSVTHEGYDENRFKPQSKQAVEKIKTKYKIVGDYVIFVGTLQPRKNIERLIEAFSQVIGASGSQVIGNKIPDNLKLVVVGKKGWLYEPIFQKVKDLKLQDKIIFTDFVPDNDLPYLISGAKLYVLPSLWEGFGIPVIEAQACGVPTIVSNVSSLPEIVGDSAILIDTESPKSIASAIEKILSNEKTRADLIRKGFENIKRFSWQKCAQETLKVLEGL